MTTTHLPACVDTDTDTDTAAAEVELTDVLDGVLTDAANAELADVLFHPTHAAQQVDPLRLHVTVDLLGALLADLNTMGPELFRRAMLRRVETAQALLAAAMPPLAERRPLVLEPGHLASQMSKQGQLLTPVIGMGVAPTLGLSSAEVWMPPGHVSFAHVHHHTGVGVLVLQGEAVTVWWDVDGNAYELAQRAGQHLYIPHGVPHAAINPHRGPVVAAEFRGNSVFNADNVLLPGLDKQVAQLMTLHAAA